MFIDLAQNPDRSTDLVAISQIIAAEYTAPISKDDITEQIIDGVAYDGDGDKARDYAATLVVWTSQLVDKPAFNPMGTTIGAVSVSRRYWLQGDRATEVAMVLASMPRVIEASK